MKKMVLAILVAGSFTAAFANYNMATSKGCHGKEFQLKAMG